MTTFTWLMLLATTAARPDTLVVPVPGIVVTGTRTPEAAFRAPAAITVVDRTRFAGTRNISLQDALSGIPGVFVQSRGGGQDVRVTIRGFGARGNGERSNAGNMRGIRVLTDGIPVSEPDGRTSLDLVDLGAADRVEVARSNSSVLYGNASGGVVHLRTNLDFDSPFVRYEQRAGSFGFHREQGVAGFVMGRSRATFSVANSTFQGWREHSESFTTLAQARVAAPIGDGGRLLVLGDAVGNLNRFPGALTAAQYDADREQANPTFLGRDERRRNRVGRIAAVLDQKLGERQDITASLFAEPKSLMRSERNRFRDFTRYHLGGSGTWSMHQTFGPGVAGRTTAGIDEAYQDGPILFYDLAPGGTRSTTVFANKREGANSAGGFVQQSFTWNERWSAQASARYDNLFYISEDFINPTLSSSKRFTKVTPKGSVSYLADHHTVFVALGGGVEAPAFNEIDPPPGIATSFNPFLEPMQSTTYEIGARGDLPGVPGKVRYDAAVYWIDVKNDIIPYFGGAYFSTAGKSRRQGAEFGLDWQPMTNVTLRGSGTLSNNEYLEYRNNLGSFDGNEIAGLPKAVFSASARYDSPRGLSVEVSSEGVGKYWVDDANTAETFAYGLLNARLEYGRELAPGSIRGFVSGNNLLDKEYVASVFINGINGQYFEPGLPFNVSAGLTLMWK